MTWPFGKLPMFGFDFAMIDAPWTFALHSPKGEAKAAQAQYACMSLAEIKALPIGDLLRPDAVVMLWATNPMLPQAFEALDAWSIKFKTAGHWVKHTDSGKLSFGTGYLLRCAGEPFLIGTVGKPRTTRVCRSIIEGPVREHSRKPDEAYAWAEALMPGAMRADIFARQRRPRWVAWGHEVSKFDGAVSENRSRPGARAVR